MAPPTRLNLLSIALWTGAASAHLAAWNKGMYCLNGNTGSIDLNTASPVTPLYQLSKNDWWFHHVNNCDQFPPADGDFLELPAGGDFTVEIASNRAKTSLSYNGRDTTDWPDGATYPEDYNIPECIISPNLHAQNQSMAAGTAFAISYTSDIKQVTAENLAVFTVRYHTPWKRITSYSVPAGMPSCPPGGCICAWGWVPNGCGQPNMYHQAFRCTVTGATSTVPIAPPQPPVWCEDDSSKCVKGAKQMIYWNQNEGNNIQVDGFDLSGHPKSPAYNAKCGFPDGAQNDIFSGNPNNAAPPPSTTTTAAATSTSTQAGGAPAPSSGDYNNNAAPPPAATTTSTSTQTSGTPAPSNGGYNNESPAPGSGETSPKNDAPGSSNPPPPGGGPSSPSSGNPPSNSNSSPPNSNNPPSDGGYSSPSSNNPSPSNSNSSPPASSSNPQPTSNNSNPPPPSSNNVNSQSSSNSGAIIIKNGVKCRDRNARRSSITKKSLAPPRLRRAYHHHQQHKRGGVTW